MNKAYYWLCFAAKTAKPAVMIATCTTSNVIYEQLHVCGMAAMFLLPTIAPTGREDEEPSAAAGGDGTAAGGVALVWEGGTLATGGAFLVSVGGGLGGDGGLGPDREASTSLRSPGRHTLRSQVSQRSCRHMQPYILTWQRT